MTAIGAGIGAESRVGTAVGVSLILHVMGMTVFVYKAEQKTEVKEQNIENVDILDEKLERKQVQPKPKRVRREQLAKDFFKLALPTRPKGLRNIEMKAPEARKTMMDVPKIDLGKRKLREEMQKLDIGKDRAKIIKMDQKLEFKRRSLADVPKLAEVGRVRAAPQVLQLAKLAEKRERAQLQIGSIDLGGDRRRSFDAGPRAVAKTRTDPGKSRLLSMLPEEQPQIKLEPRMAPRRPIAAPEITPPPPLPTRRRTQALEEVVEEKKAVEIEGPLSSRRVVNHSVPEFPQKLEEYGVYEAEVRIKFYVTPAGAVLEDRMSVEKSSSYGWLDRLAMTHLKKWRFEQLPLGGSNEWGVITFRFFLE